MVKLSSDPTLPEGYFNATKKPKKPLPRILRDDPHECYPEPTIPEPSAGLLVILSSLFLILKRAKS
jgi:hypothetical protein